MYCIFFFRQIFKQFLTKRVLSNPLQRRFFKENDLYELFTLGDVCPKKRTETGDIFAGTGSQVNFKKMKKNNKKEKKKNINENIEEPEKQMTEIIDDSLNGCAEETDTQCTSKHSDNEKLSLDYRQNNSHISTETNSNLCSIFNDSKKKKTKKKKEKVVKVEGVSVQNVAKSEVFKKEEKESEDNIQTEDDILLSLYKTAGIHSALKHDQIEHADDPDFVLVEKEAARVASEAITRLKASRAECKRNGLKVPTYTGSASKTQTKKRFGNKSFTYTKDSNKTSMTTLKSDDKLSNKNDKLKEKESLIDLSSSSLLARMKSRSSGMINLITSHVPSSSESAEDKLAKDIQEYLAQRIDGSATSDEITSFFKSRLEDGEQVVFKQLLKRFCTLSNSVWTLRHEFL